MKGKTETAVFGGGCFWCTEAVFKMIGGVTSVDPGYTGGTKKNPTYEEVSSGVTGYIEVIRVRFDPLKVPFRELLAVFFASHDPTSVDSQGVDIGSQYRSVIFYTSEEQRVESERSVKKLKTALGRPVATEILPLGKFYLAEEYHKDYYEHNHDAPYCRLVIDPKLKKIREKFKDLIKK